MFHCGTAGFADVKKVHDFATAQGIEVFLKAKTD
jgi:hypothetical protein